MKARRELLYLAYGSNLLPARLAARTPSAQPLGTVNLPGRALRWHKRGSDGSGKCDLVEVPRGECTAHGAIYRLDAGEKARLDAIEGVGHGYAEERLAVEGYGEVFLYVAEPAHVDPAQVPYAWYHRFVLDGARWHGFPPAYVEAIARVPTAADPDPARAEENLRILAGAMRPLP